MFVYEKKLQYPVNIKQTNAKLAKIIITHSGKYTVNGDTITAAFDDGETTTSFYIHRNGDKIQSISLNYEDYEVYFTLNN